MQIRITLGYIQKVQLPESQSRTINIVGRVCISHLKKDLTKFFKTEYWEIKGGKDLGNTNVQPGVINFYP